MPTNRQTACEVYMAFRSMSYLNRRRAIDGDCGCNSPKNSGELEAAYIKALTYVLGRREQAQASTRLFDDADEIEQEH